MEKRRDGERSPLFGKVEGLPTHIYISSSHNEVLFSEVADMCNKIKREGRDYLYGDDYVESERTELWCDYFKSLPHAHIGLVTLLPESNEITVKISGIMKQWFGV